MEMERRKPMTKEWTMNTSTPELITSKRFHVIALNFVKISLKFVLNIILISNFEFDLSSPYRSNS